MLKPYDFKARVCRVDDGVKEYGKLYFSQLSRTWGDVSKVANEDYESIIWDKLHESTVCVKACPAKQGDAIECPPDDES